MADIQPLNLNTPIKFMKFSIDNYILQRSSDKYLKQTGNPYFDINSVQPSDSGYFVLSFTPILESSALLLQLIHTLAFETALPKDLSSTKRILNVAIINHVTHFRILSLYSKDGRHCSRCTKRP